MFLVSKETKREIFRPEKLCSGLVSFTRPSRLSSLPISKEQWGLQRAALGRAALTPGTIFCSLSTSRLGRETINGLLLCFYEQETTNKATIYNGQENYLNKIAVG